MARNAPEFIQAVPLANLRFGKAAMELQKMHLISVENLDERVRNFVKVATLILVELCVDPDMTEEKALLGYSIALEMFGITPEKISEIMSRPLPEFA
jgi:alkylhydroperoxidase/carboxymuconolactone decarboxylase family protein YurZ